MQFHFPDSDTGYYDPEERFYELDGAHESAEEARYLEELQAAHSPESDPDPEFDYREFAINMARQQARSITSNKESA
jgi:hypothetical protein